MQISLKSRKDALALALADETGEDYRELMKRSGEELRDRIRLLKAGEHKLMKKPASQVAIAMGYDAEVRSKLRAAGYKCDKMSYFEIRDLVTSHNLEVRMQYFVPSQNKAEMQARLINMGYSVDDMPVKTMRALAKRHNHAHNVGGLFRFGRKVKREIRAGVRDFDYYEKTYYMTRQTYEKIKSTADDSGRAGEILGIRWVKNEQ